MKQYLYNGNVYTDVYDVDVAISEKLSEQGFNNQDVPRERLQEIWENEVEEV